ncbi:MAG: stage II sporulation protein P [Oscillospiraceae bacterium]|nr:stage II sporulation protein P [Oscillospiraceae bacterium]
MKDLRRARRTGAAAIVCALMMRLWSAGGPQALVSWLFQQNIASFLTDSETGQNVRFSSSLDTFSPDFAETPLPLLPEPTEPPLPFFSDTEEIDLYYAVSKDPDIPALLTQPLKWDLRGALPTVLVLHTHSTESYTKAGENYKESAAWRTLDEGYNMLSIGDQVVQLLATNGICAIQDRTLHDYPSYNGSYTRARKTIQAYLEEYPTISLVLDLHRDASGSENRQMRTRCQAAGQDSAQLMLVIGTNHDGFEENLSLALKLHAQLEALAPGIMRPLQLRASRFNQDLCPGAVLVEVGAAGNTHAEAQLAAQTLGQAVIALARGTQGEKEE